MAPKATEGAQKIARLRALGSSPSQGEVAPKATEGAPEGQDSGPPPPRGARHLPLKGEDFMLSAPPTPTRGNASAPHYRNQIENVPWFCSALQPMFPHSAVKPVDQPSAPSTVPNAIVTMLSPGSLLFGLLRKSV